MFKDKVRPPINFIPTLLLFSFLCTLPACDKYLDVNEDPTRVHDANLELLLPTAIISLSMAHYYSGYRTSFMSHQAINYAGYSREFTNSQLWSKIYLEGINNIHVLVETALTPGEEYAPTYAGIGKIIEANYLSILTDTWENIPYSEALQGSKIIRPSYDTQEQVYSEIQRLLDESLVLLRDNDSPFRPQEDDMVYSGDLDKWVRLAHALKARYMLHLSKKTIDWNALFLEIDEGFTSNNDNFLLNHTGTRDINPWTAQSRPLEGVQQFYISSYFVNLMNGTLYNIWDPRLPIIATLQSGQTEYHGTDLFEPWSGTVDFDIDSWYGRLDAPSLMMTYSELKFIEAEAALHVNDTQRATAAYFEGIDSNMDMLGVAEEDKIAYLNAPEISTVDMEHIMTQKFLALFLHHEIWTDMRRLDFDPTIFKGFEEPDINGQNTPAQRALYPKSERMHNFDNVTANQKGFAEPMWFAQ